MILPIITAISREVFVQTPAAARGGIAGPRRHPLGDDPPSRHSVRTLRRHLAARCSASAGHSARRWRSRSSCRPPTGYFWDVLTGQNSNTIAANIALQFPESSGLEVNRLIATGLVLFVITFGVNAIARRIANAGFSGADG